MKSNPQDDELLRSYLLGELPGQDADLLEGRLLEDDDLFDLCEAIEGDLLAACARGELAPRERGRVLRRLASSSQGRERLAQARALNTVADELPATGRAVKPAKAPVVPFIRRAPVPAYRTRWAAALAASLLLLAGSFALVQQLRLSGASPQGPRRPSAARIAETLRPAEAPLASIELSLVTLRGAESEVHKLAVPPGGGFVELRLYVRGIEDFKSFRATIRNQETGREGPPKELKLQKSEKGPNFIFDVPADQLSAGGYEVRVQGLTEGGESEELGSQDFEVVRVGKR